MKKFLSVLALPLSLGACADVYEVAYAPSVAIDKARATGYANAVALQTTPDERRALMFQMCSNSMTSSDLNTLKSRGETVADACTCIVSAFNQKANQSVWAGALVGPRHKSFGAASNLYENSIQSCGLTVA